MNTLIIACRTISDELNLAVKETGCDYPILWIESGLHINPDALRIRLQEEMEHLSNIEQVLMAFGYCGNSLLGLIPPTYRMIFPRVDDCITLMLGSCQKRKEISDEMGTYFLTKGWLDYEKNIWVEYQDTIKRMGKSKADRVYNLLLKHYKRLAVIDTGAYKMEDFLSRSQNVAKDLKLEHQTVPGTLRYLKKLLTGPWDEEFITIQPGETVILDHIYGDTI